MDEITKNVQAKSQKVIRILALLLLISTIVVAGMYVWNNCASLDNASHANATVVEFKEIAPTETEQEKISRIIIVLKPQLDPKIADIIASSVIKNSKEYNLPASLVVSIMNRESGFNTMAISSMGAKGLMQVMTKVHKDKMKKMGINNYEAMHIDNSTKLGCSILREYLNTEKTTESALERYVGGKHKGYMKDVLATYLNINMMLSEKKVKTEKKKTTINASANGICVAATTD